MKWRVAFKVGRWVQLEYCFLPPESLSDEQSVECVGEIRVRQRQKSGRSRGVKRDPIFIFGLVLKWSPMKEDIKRAKRAFHR